eukprot:1952999-Rhodomonas_salina.1
MECVPHISATGHGNDAARSRGLLRAARGALRRRHVVPRRRSHLPLGVRQGAVPLRRPREVGDARADDPRLRGHSRHVPRRHDRQLRDRVREHDPARSTLANERLRGRRERGRGAAAAVVGALHDRRVRRQRELDGVRRRDVGLAGPRGRAVPPGRGAALAALVRPAPAVAVGADDGGARAARAHVRAHRHHRAHLEAGTHPGGLARDASGAGARARRRRHWVPAVDGVADVPAVVPGLGRLAVRRGRGARHEQQAAPRRNAPCHRHDDGALPRRLLLLLLAPPPLRSPPRRPLPRPRRRHHRRASHGSHPLPDVVLKMGMGGDVDSL